MNVRITLEPAYLDRLCYTEGMSKTLYVVRGTPNPNSVWIAGSPEMEVILRARTPCIRVASVGGGKSFVAQLFDSYTDTVIHEIEGAGRWRFERAVADLIQVLDAEPR